MVDGVFSVLLEEIRMKIISKIPQNEHGQKKTFVLLFVSSSYFSLCVYLFYFVMASGKS